MSHAIITLTTDFGEKDHFAGAVKGALYSELKTIQIVDISHCISPFHISEAAYIIQNAYKSFPSGSIHIIGIDSELNPENKQINSIIQWCLSEPQSSNKAPNLSNYISKENI